MPTAPNVGTWNVEYDNTDANIKAGLTALVNAGMDVIGCQELSNDNKWAMAVRHMKALGYEWGGANNACPIFVGRNWSIVKVGNERVTGGGDKIESSNAGGHTSAVTGYKSVTWAQIKHKDGSRALVANNHIVPTIESGGKLINPLRLAIYRRQVEMVGKVVADAIAAKIPVAVTGDFNLSYGTTAGKDVEKRMAAYGLKPCWAETKARGTHGSRTIDYVWHNVRARTTKILAKNGSDHSAVACDLTTSASDDPDPEPEKPMPVKTYLVPTKGSINDNARAICAEIVAKFPGIPNVWGYATTADHNTKRCVDYMAPTKAIGDAVAQYHIDNAKRLGLNFLVWRGRAWRPVANSHGPKGWGPYYAPTTHFDHVHGEYSLAGKAIAVAPWDGKGFPGADAFRVGYRNPAVTLLDQRLIAHGLTPAGYDAGQNFTAATLAIVKKFQVAQGWTGDSADGIPGPSTWELLMKAPVVAAPHPEPTLPPVVTPPKVQPVYLDKLVEGTKDSDSVKAAQAALVALGAANVAPTGDFGPGTTAAVKEFQRSLVTGVLSAEETAHLFKLAKINVTIEEKS